MNIHHYKDTPSKWPFPAKPAKPVKRGRGRLSRGAMFVDICLVAVWGASIPGLMWLGAAGGF
ncbi:hypothetical protein [Parapusillimonas granuli]|uniref:Uncharacterized protein n=1 Tax=Parapusillimonas granuli TaxID=380911 RepID=A0A853G6B6_9BURK|nr:hypothetical protein [Parapusillimonas granuli]MBB5217091.1 hypothetical protein [Parapusillimonas granuli]MEB2401556.1 hypothetical protein [Alcaligenaceae bacterium]NYT50146.1 hypothetical protein [Parapusillimonas granuli]